MAGNSTKNKGLNKRSRARVKKINSIVREGARDLQRTIKKKRSKK